MLPLDFIKDHYASLPTEKLIEFVRKDFKDLTPEASVLLKQEFSVRCLKIENYLPAIQELQDEDDFYLDLNISKEREGQSITGVPNQEIMLPLTDDEKEQMLPEESLESLASKYERTMKNYGILLGIGIAFTIFTLVIATEYGGGTFYIAGGPIIIGLIGLVNANGKRNRYLQILAEKKENEKNFPHNTPLNP